MYKEIIRPLLFKFTPESIHHFIVGFLKSMRYIPFARIITRKMFKTQEEELRREFFGLSFPSPVGFAAGFDKNAECYDVLGDFGFGFIEVGTVTPKPQGGNPKPRCFRLSEDQAIINRMGFNNNGTVCAVRKLQKYRRRGVVIGGNIGKNTLTANENAPKDYLKVFRALYDYVDYFTVNVSCPNVEGLTALQNKDGVGEILKGLKEFRKGQCDYRPILLKISPDLTHEQIDAMIEVALQYKVDGIVATNTSTSREGLSDKEKVQNIGKGGLSGAPLFEKSIATVRYIYSKIGTKMPIVGVGGIMTEAQALEMLRAGASLIQVYSGFIYQGPSFVKRVNKAILSQQN
ncbi:MAG: quinone-dependent dihydroorotate dehydrogenase [Rikenellaceae bacterium]